MTDFITCHRNGQEFAVISKIHLLVIDMGDNGLNMN